MYVCVMVRAVLYECLCNGGLCCMFVSWPGLCSMYVCVMVWAVCIIVCVMAWAVLYDCLCHGLGCVVCMFENGLGCAV